MKTISSKAKVPFTAKMVVDMMVNGIKTNDKVTASTSILTVKNTMGSGWLTGNQVMESITIWMEPSIMESGIMTSGTDMEITST